MIIDELIKELEKCKLMEAELKSLKAHFDRPREPSDKAKLGLAEYRLKFKDAKIANLESEISELKAIIADDSQDLKDEINHLNKVIVRDKEEIIKLKFLNNMTSHDDHLFLRYVQEINELKDKVINLEKSIFHEKVAKERLLDTNRDLAARLNSVKKEVCRE